MRAPAESSASASTAARLLVGELAIDRAAGELRRGGERIRLAPKPFAILDALLERPGEVVTREELRRRLWPDGTFVDFDNNLNSALATLRDALGDTAAAPRYVETLPKRGYRWIGPPPAAPSPGRRGRRDALRLGAALLAVAALAAAGVALLGRDATPGAVGPAEEARLRGRYLLSRGDADATLVAVRELERATELAPRNAPAWADLARALRSLPGPARAHEARARQAAERALALDPELAEAHRQLGLLALYVDYDWSEAERRLARAYELAPDSAEVAQSRAGLFAASGRHDEAAREMARARAVDPVSVTIAADAGWYRFVARDWAGTLAACEAALGLDPAHPGALYYRELAYRALGDLPRAAEAARAHARVTLPELALSAAADPQATLAAVAAARLTHRRELAARQYVSPGQLALDALAAGERGAAFDLLERAVEERGGWLPPFLGVYPPLDPLRDEPRFRALVERLALPATALVEPPAELRFGSLAR